MPVTNVEAVWSSGKLQFVDASTKTVLFEIDTTGPDPRARIKETISSNKTLNAEDVGKIMEVDTDAVVITLPSTVVGYIYHIRNVAADAAAKVSVDPAIADKIMGPDIAGVDNKDLINTKLTAKKGDYVILIGDGSLGWYVVDVNGTWAAEA